ncbi:MAG: hypothetical protein WA061_01975 [Microgenomates group bacterium]
MFRDYDFSLDENNWVFNENPYYNPEKCGLEIVAQIDLSSGSYEFDYIVVWKAKNGKIYTASDSGCSCPTPFEDFHSLSDLTEMNQSTVLDSMKERIRNSSYVSPVDAQEFMYKIRDAVYNL